MNTHVHACSTSGALLAQPQPARACRFVAPRALHNAFQRAAVRTQSRAGCRGQRRAAQLQVQASYGSQWQTPGDAYVTIGLAHCFEKTDDGKVTDRFVIEPITANSVECMATGAKTCFKYVFSMPLEEALAKNKASFPAEFAEGVFCENYDARCDACARTWMRPHAMENLMDLVPLGQLKSKFNYNLDDKRVLNFENVVNDDDNIKQDLSIDVYGRKEKEEEEAAPAKEAEEEDDMDALLAV